MATQDDLYKTMTKQGIPPETREHMVNLAAQIRNKMEEDLQAAGNEIEFFELMLSHLEKATSVGTSFAYIAGELERLAKYDRAHGYLTETEPEEGFEDVH